MRWLAARQALDVEVGEADAVEGCGAVAGQSRDAGRGAQRELAPRGGGAGPCGRDA